MGVETALIIGLAGMSALGTMSNAQAAAKSTINEGNAVAKNKAKEVQMKAARVQSNFMSSGLTLEGTANTAIIGQYDTGLEDINNIRTNYNRRAKSQISEGRTAALSKLAGAFAGSAMGGSIAGGAESATNSFAYGLNDMGFGNQAYDMLEASDGFFG